MFLDKLISKIGLKPITDLIAGNNGVISLLKENSSPKSKISAKKGAASALLFAAIKMALTGDYTWERITLICVFALCGTILLYVSAKYKEK